MYPSPSLIKTKIHLTLIPRKIKSNRFDHRPFDFWVGLGSSVSPHKGLEPHVHGITFFEHLAVAAVHDHSYFCDSEIVSSFHGDQVAGLTPLTARADIVNHRRIEVVGMSNTESCILVGGNSL